MRETMKKRMGVTDTPCTSEKEDLLGISNYVKGLEKFIRECQTPMSIAIQGDWGTGKTSTLNLLKRNLEMEKNSIRCVFFNTWQYSQFNMENSLYVSFVYNLVKQCGGNDTLAKEIWKKICTIGKQVVFRTVDQTLGTNSYEIFDRLEKDKMEQMENISRLQEDFAELVKKTGKRLVIFIDDLDRLNPEVAVELLEVIKLFVNVENTIFILAIDYEVVVSGVRKKYGESLSEEKCRNFFDKIIQLPFKMPVERYNLKRLVSEVVKDNMSDKYIDIVVEFISDVMGTNPRTFKRLVNAFFLIKSVNEIGGETNSDTEEFDDALMFCSLCVQMCLPKLYQLMITTSTKEQLKELLELESPEEIKDYAKKYLIDLDGSDKEFNEIHKALRLFHGKVVDSIGEKFKEDRVWNSLYNLLAMTSITAVSASGVLNPGRKAAMKVTEICVNGKSSYVASANIAIANTFEILLGQNPLYIEEFMLQNPGLLTKDAAKKDSLFRQRKVLFEGGNEAVYLGVSSGTEVKMKQVEKLCLFLKDKGQSNQVRWFNEKNEIFCF